NHYFQGQIDTGLGWAVDRQSFAQMMGLSQDSGCGRTKETVERKACGTWKQQMELDGVTAWYKDAKGELPYLTMQPETQTFDTTYMPCWASIGSETDQTVCTNDSSKRPYMLPYIEYSAISPNAG